MKPLLQEPSDVLCLRPSCHATMAIRATEEREYRLLTESRKTYPKYPLTRSNPIQQRDSIIHANIPEFRQEKRTFWGKRRLSSGDYAQQSLSLWDRLQVSNPDCFSKYYCNYSWLEFIYIVYLEKTTTLDMLYRSATWFLGALFISMRRS